MLAGGECYFPILVPAFLLYLFIYYFTEIWFHVCRSFLALDQLISFNKNIASSCKNIKCIVIQEFCTWRPLIKNLLHKNIIHINNYRNIQINFME